MASDPPAGLTCQANGENTPGRVSGSGRSCRHLSESESDVVPTVKSLARLCSRDEEERAAALEELSQGVLVCLGLDRPGSARLTKQTLLHLLRLSLSCPLQEVRGKATELLRTAQVTKGHYLQFSVLHNIYRPAGTQREVGDGEAMGRIFRQEVLYINNVEKFAISLGLLLFFFMMKFQDQVNDLLIDVITLQLISHSYQLITIFCQIAGHFIRR